MGCTLRRLKLFSREKFKHEFASENLINPFQHISVSPNRKLHTQQNANPNFHSSASKSESNPVSFFHEFVKSGQNSNDLDDKSAISVQNLLRDGISNPVEELEKALVECKLSLTEDFVSSVIRRHRSDWKPALIFFNWVCKVSYSLPDASVYNEILDILGRMKRFDELTHLLDEMSKRGNIFNEKSYHIVVHRYASAHKIEAAINFFYRRKEFGLDLDVVAFQTLLMSLCRYKHVEAAESLFHSKQIEFRMDIKTMNIILNGWCVRGNVREAKRFWNDIIVSRCKPDLYTYGIFINSLTKSGKLNTAVKLFKSMWEKGCAPDVAICNCIIDALCFKKRIPEALEVFQEMNEKKCCPNVATYNSLIKHLCNIMRMEKVYELLDEMETKKGSCAPNARTYGYLLKTTKKTNETVKILDRMEKNGCEMDADIYNLMLKLYMDVDDQDKVRSTWIEMEKKGLGPDQRSYTVMIHGLFDIEKIDDALSYFNEMTFKGMVPEPRTILLVDAMNIKLKENNASAGGNLSRRSGQRRQGKMKGR